jgi:hypothetical protein
VTPRTATRAAILLNVLVALLGVAGLVLTLATRPPSYDAPAAFLLGLFGATAAA